ncbi:hypothetical protein AAVH_03285 [Aphelenchoides avenae]|nr:hypothetical protein AAVH_03285 [Aphelenchus avenae]
MHIFSKTVVVVALVFGAGLLYAHHAEVLTGAQHLKDSALDMFMLGFTTILLVQGETENIEAVVVGVLISSTICVAGINFGPQSFADFSKPIVTCFVWLYVALLCIIAVTALVKGCIMIVKAAIAAIKGDESKEGLVNPRGFDNPNLA